MLAGSRGIPRAGSAQKFLRPATNPVNVDFPGYLSPDGSMSDLPERSGGDDEGIEDQFWILRLDPGFQLFDGLGKFNRRAPPRWDSFQADR
jgi:hypothetical protein